MCTRTPRREKEIILFILPQAPSRGKLHFRHTRKHDAIRRGCEATKRDTASALHPVSTSSVLRSRAETEQTPTSSAAGYSPHVSQGFPDDPTSRIYYLRLTIYYLTRGTSQRMPTGNLSIYRRTRLFRLNLRDTRVAIRCLAALFCCAGWGVVVKRGHGKNAFPKNS